MADVRGRVAVVTGAASGMGRATAEALAADGAKVALLGRKLDGLKKVADSIIATGGQALALAADVAELDTLHDAASQIHEAFGRVDLLVNAAGTLQAGPFATQNVDEWRTMIDTNYIGVLQATHVFLPTILDGGGDIVVISSDAGRKVLENYAVYSSTKWAVIGWAEALRFELANSDVRVALVEPGLTNSGQFDGLKNKEVQVDLRHQVETLSPLQPRDVAEAIVFAVSRPRYVSINEIWMTATKGK